MSYEIDIQQVMIFLSKLNYVFVPLNKKVIGEIIYSDEFRIIEDKYG